MLHWRRRRRFVGDIMLVGLARGSTDSFICFATSPICAGLILPASPNRASLNRLALP